MNAFTISMHISELNLLKVNMSTIEDVSINIFWALNMFGERAVEVSLMEKTIEFDFRA